MQIAIWSRGPRQIRTLVMRKIHRHQEELKSCQGRRPIQPSGRVGRVIMKKRQGIGGRKSSKGDRLLQGKKGGVGKDRTEGNESWQEARLGRSKISPREKSKS